MKEKNINPGKSIKVLICDDEARVRQALKTLLLTREIVRVGDPSAEIRVVGEAWHGAEALRMVENLRPNVVIMDASMPGIGGMEATRLIKRKWPQVKVVMLTMYPDTRPAALDAGVDTFLLKGCLAETLIDAILS
jgi:DNA-binding NarL/FixJ family response regulator